MNTALVSTAASLGVFHTLMGVDHYVPFAAMGKANNWSYSKTMFVVFVCGAGHIISSVLVGIIGIWLGTHLGSGVYMEGVGSEIANWLLISYGVIYMLWGIRNAIKNKPHRHRRIGGGNAAQCPENNLCQTSESHEHDFETVGVHSEKSRAVPTFWPLFVMMVLGPCEFLIPLFMYPAAESGAFSVILVATVFSICTIATMLVCTLVVLKGINMIPMKKFERFSHAIAGGAILLCGVVIRFSGS